MDKKRDSKRGKGVGRKKEDFGTDNTRGKDKNDKVKGDEGKNDKVKRERGKNDKVKREESKNDKVKREESKNDKVKREESKNDKDNKDEVIVIVNGKRLPMGNFPKKIIKEIVVAMVSSLRGGEGAEEIEIKIIK